MKRILALCVISFLLMSLVGCGGGGGSSPTNPSNPPVESGPIISSIEPSSIAAQSPAFTLTVNGSNFQQNSVITWSGRDLPTQFVSSNRLTASISTADIPSINLITIRVRLPNGTISNATSFTVSAPTSNPVPVVYYLDPQTITAGSTAFTLTVNGSAFVAGSKILVDGVERTTQYLDSSNVSTAFTASEIAEPKVLRISVKNPAPGGGTSSELRFGVTVPVKKVSVAAGNLIYDKLRNRIYATVQASAPQFANSVTVIDPATGNVGPSIPVAANPNRMAISDDGSYLYVSINSDGSISRINLTTMAIDLKIPMTSPTTDPPTDLAVMPGHPRTIAVSASRRVAVYDDDVRRPNLTDWNDGTGLIQFGATPDVLYVNPTYSQTVLYVSIDANGATTKDKVEGRFYADTSLSFDSGFLYSNKGVKYETATKNRAGRFSLPTWTNCSVADPAAGKGYSLSWNDSIRQSELTLYDAGTFTPQSSLIVPNVGTNACRMITWGSGGLAYSTFSDVSIVSPKFPAPEPFSSISLDRVVSRRLLHDRARNRIYATVPGIVPVVGNSVIAIDPTTKAIVSSINVGSEPNAMALAGDGSALYVALDEQDAVRKIDLTSGKATELRQMRKNATESTIKIGDLAVMPGAPGTIAVSRIVQGQFPLTSSDISIYDPSGPRTAFAYGIYSSAPMLVAFSESPNTLFVVDDAQGVSYNRMAVDSTGVKLVVHKSWDEYQRPRSVFYSGGRLYASNGGVVDTTNDTFVGFAKGVPMVDGFYADPSSNRMYFMAWTGYTELAVAYDMTTLLPVNYLAAAAQSVGNFGHDLIVLSDLRFAWATERKTVITDATLSALPVMSIGSSVLPPTAPGKNYSYGLFALSPSGTARWNLDHGSLPPGLTLDANGLISGTVGAVNTETTYRFTAWAVAASVPPALASRDFSILVKTGTLGSNDSCAAATPISFGRLAASISPYGDSDVYSFDGTQGTKPQIYANPVGSTSLPYVQLDPVIELLDDKCSRLTTADDIYPGNVVAAISDFTLPYTGKYYIRVMDVRGDGRPDFRYTLTVWPQ